MAQSLQSDFKIYQDQFRGGYVEMLVQNTAAFNAASRGAIRNVPLASRGNYRYESFIDVISALVSRRDTTSTSTVSDTAATQDEFISAKLDRKVGPIGISLDALKKVQDPREASFIIGQQTAKAVEVSQLNDGLLAARAALANVAALNFDASDGTLATTDLVSGLGKAGDTFGEVVLWVMHSKVYFDLLGNQITNALYRNDRTRILEGMPVSLDIPVLVSDSSSLIVTDGVSTGVDSYYTLGLRPGGVEINESEPATMVSELVTGYENMFVRVQGELAYNVGLKGFKWDVANGGANPNGTALGTGSNWDKAVTSDQNLAGVIIESQ